MSNLRRSFFFVSLMIVALIAAACGGGGSGNGGDGEEQSGVGGPGPAVVAQQALEGVLSFNFEAVANLSCVAIRDQVQEMADEMAELVELMGEFQIDSSNVTYTVTDQTDTSATVVVGGTIIISAMGEEETQDASDILGDEGIPMVVEDGQWRICDPSLVS